MQLGHFCTFRRLKWAESIFTWILAVWLGHWWGCNTVLAVLITSMLASREDNAVHNFVMYATIGLAFTSAMNCIKSSHWYQLSREIHWVNIHRVQMSWLKRSDVPQQWIVDVLCTFRFTKNYKSTGTCCIWKCGALWAGGASLAFTTSGCNSKHYRTYCSNEIPFQNLINAPESLWACISCLLHVARR